MKAIKNIWLLGNGSLPPLQLMTSTKNRKSLALPTRKGKQKSWFIISKINGSIMGRRSGFVLHGQINIGIMVF